MVEEVGKRVVVLGSQALDPTIQGAGSCRVNPCSTLSILDAIKA